MSTDTLKLLRLLRDGGDIVVGLGNGEPRNLIATLDAHAGRLDGVRVHQMHALQPHPFILGERGDHLRYVAYFLGNPAVRDAFARGDCDFVPANFSDVPAAMAARNPKLICCQTSPADADGYYSLGTNAEYAAAFIGRVPFAVEVNPRMPRTLGPNRVHASQVVCRFEADAPLHAVPPPPAKPEEFAIARHVAALIGDGATIQTGIGAIPNAVLGLLADRSDLGLHTELLTEGVIDLVERGALTGARKARDAGLLVATFALGSKRLYEWLHENPLVELRRVDEVNDPYRIAEHGASFVSINATTEIDLYGQCASETMAGRYHSGAGGQVDFVRGARRGGGLSVIVTRAETSAGFSRIRPALASGSVVTTPKTDVDVVCTEYGTAQLAGATYRERAQRLIAIAHPRHREWLEEEAWLKVARGDDETGAAARSQPLIRPGRAVA
jgi:acyl-CoA hydrolase